MNDTVHQQALLKLHWAEQNIRKIETEIEQLFGNLDPTPILRENNSEAGTVTYRVKYLPPIPPNIQLLAGDVLHSFRCALDYIAVGMVKAACNSLATPNVKFPISRSAKDFPALLNKLIPGIGQLAHETVERIQPYNGGRTWLWHLHRLNNLDKHRLLLAVGFVYVGRSLTPYEKGGMPGVNLIRQAGHRGPLNAGDEITILPVAETQDKVGFRFDVALQEPGLPEWMPLTLLLDLISTEVRFVIRDLIYFT